MEKGKYREDCKDKWFYKLIDHMKDEDIEKSVIKNKCVTCNEEKLVKSFVIPAWWDGYQSWFDECWECRFKKTMSGIGDTLVKLHQKFPDLEVSTSIVTPKESLTFETKTKK